MTHSLRSQDSYERYQLEAIFEQSPAAIVLWRGPDFIFEKMNHKYQEIFPGRNLLGKPLLEAMPELADQPFYQLIKDVFETGKPFVGHEMPAYLKSRENGEIEEHFYDFNFIQVCDAQGKPYGVYNHSIDVTERVLDRIALEDSQKELQSAVLDLKWERELREKFVAALTHDLRTPLSSAKMSAQMLGRKVSEPELNKKVTGIVKNLDRVDSMIRDLLDANRIKAGERLPLDIGECNLNELAESTIKDLANVHGDRFQLIADEIIIGSWDCRALISIFENLAGNAVKYGSLTGPILINLKRDKHEVEIAVHNEGNVISVYDQKAIFDFYKRAGTTSTNYQTGWGIGLTLVRGFAEAHGGHVNLKSSPEEGTTFSVRMPLSGQIIN